MTSFSVEHFVPGWLETDKLREKLRLERLNRLAQFVVHKEEAAPKADDTFEQLLALSKEYAPDTDEHGQLAQRIDSLAEELKTEIDPETDQTNQAVANLTNTWQALSAWDRVRDDATADLALRMLNNLPGSGQANLTRAFVYARDTGTAFDTALDIINGHTAA